MRTHGWLVFALTFTLAGCGAEPAPQAPPRGDGGAAAPAPGASAPAPAPALRLDPASPRALAESLFAIAKGGDLALLAPLADPLDSDGDSKQIAAIAQAPAKEQTDFRAAFGTGKVNGEIQAEGDHAEVPILFGPDGTRPETLKLVRRDGRWYLQSF